MAKVKLNWFIEGLKGKVADCNKEIKSHSIVINPYTGESITRNNGVRNLTTNPYSADELARQAKFKAAAAAVKTVMSNPTQLATYTAAFTQQTKYKTLRGYIFAQKYAEAGE